MGPGPKVSEKETVSSILGEPREMRCPLTPHAWGRVSAPDGYGGTQEGKGGAAGVEDGGWEGDGGARGKGKRSWFGNGAQEPRLELDPVGQGWGQLRLETVQGTHPGHSETLAFIPAVLGRERHRACWGMGAGLQLPTSLCL